MGILKVGLEKSGFSLCYFSPVATHHPRERRSRKRRAAAANHKCIKAGITSVRDKVVKKRSLLPRLIENPSWLSGEKNRASGLSHEEAREDGEYESTYCTTGSWTK